MRKMLCIMFSLMMFTAAVPIDIYAIDDDVVQSQEASDEITKEEQGSESNDLYNNGKSETSQDTKKDGKITDDANLVNEDDNNVVTDNNNTIDKTMINSYATDNPEIKYATHIQSIGWQGYVNDGELSGTSGRSLRLEGIKINLNLANYSGGIEYSTHVQNIGWTNSVTSDQMSGTSGKSLRLEAIKINLTGDIANYYDIYYRVHVQEFGWLDWASNGYKAGSQSYGYRLEGIEIKLLKKGEQAPSNTTTPFKIPGDVYYQTHVSDIGWLKDVGDGNTSGTVGQSKRIEAIRIQLGNLAYLGNIEYSSHVQDIGWQSYQSNGYTSGTEGTSKRVEAIKIRLSGDVENYYDIYYRTHVQNVGWLDWASNDQKSGSEGYGCRIEAIQIKLVEKDAAAPGATTEPFVYSGDILYSSHIQGIGWQGYAKNGETSGTSGQSRRIEAIKMNISNDLYAGGIEYNSYIQNIGWQGYKSDGELSGTEGQSLRIEALKIRLYGNMDVHYNVYYRVYCQSIGWLGWTANNRVAGTTGGSFRIEAIQVKLYPKIMTGPTISNRSCIYFSNKAGALVCQDANGDLYEDASGLLGSQGSYNLRVNKGTNVVTVFAADGNGVYNIAYKRFICSVGDATPIGTFYTPEKYRWRELMGPSYGQFSTRIVSGILFHSVPYNQMNNRTLSPRMYNQLGTTCSHGCVRLTCGDAKWIYDNCALGTRVVIIGSGVDPLSKPAAQKLPANQTWDPTDPTI